MENIDIKDFSSVSAVNDTDNILLARSGGSHGKMQVSLFKKAVFEGLSPNIRDGVWYVGDKNLNVQAEGKNPILETGTTTTLDPGSDATSEVVANGTDDNGNPKYKLNFGIPKGYDGAGGSGGGGTADSVQWANVLNKPSWVNSATKPTYTASEVGALPASTTIPSKTSQLTNDSGFTTSASFKTINGQSIVGSGNIAIEGGGGDTPSAGSGNVNVTNGASLETGKQYAFKPSADGSLKGTFTTIPAASSTANGLMSSADKSKLDDMKQVWKVPSAVLGLTDESTSDEIVEAFGMSIRNFYVRIASCVDNLQAEYKAYNSMKAFIGNYECLLSGHVTDGQYTIDFNYVDAGTLKTISIIQVSGGPITFACKLSEAGGGADDTYYLPVSLANNLEAGSTDEEIVHAFGGVEKIQEIIGFIMNETYSHYAFNSTLFNITASVYTILSLNLTIYFFNIQTKVERTIFIKRDGTGGFVKDIYPSGYALNPGVYSLTSSSESADISTAVGGESGLKNIIQAIKDGNRLVIRGTNDSLGDMTINQDLMCNGYKESENGDITLVISGIGYGLFGGIAGFLTINYTKSSNTFSCNYTSIS